MPPKVRESVFEVLHSKHTGVSKMKSLAQSYVWRPGMDAEIERRVTSCHSHQENQSAPAKAPLHPRGWPEYAWSHVHVDYAGLLEGHLFLILVDAYSKF